MFVHLHRYILGEMLNWVQFQARRTHWTAGMIQVLRLQTNESAAEAGILKAPSTDTNPIRNNPGVGEEIRKQCIWLSRRVSQRTLEKPP